MVYGMISFKDYLIESKKAGVVYHFTTLRNFLAMFDSNYKPIFKSEAGISLTRNHSLSTDPQVSKFSSLHQNNGAVVRFTIDGDKLSNNHKITPVKGMSHTTTLDDVLNINSKNTRMSGRVEAEELVHSKFIQMKPFIKSVEFLGCDAVNTLEDNIKEILKHSNIKFDGIFKNWIVAEGEIYNHFVLDEEFTFNG